jgi:hypothetical protein
MIDAESGDQKWDESNQFGLMQNLNGKNTM